MMIVYRFHTENMRYRVIEVVIHGTWAEYHVHGEFETLDEAWAYVEVHDRDRFQIIGVE